ncbi:ENTH domain-containing protein [Microsporum canis CBS 113480]|uniref:ENTH domain-containing protein n=1 Tax=Arthroderma otae (strain ATCC MYA-4605 / CBS 113480) TaxID=554155 RepID=C5FFY4_ARTOC|nr:ENTH domain-containing protein [Microsporum canis CBS 113480]EEQ29669.1 ENTH domain-containing protein [Microsporum canis CBS 113480]
MVGSSFEKSVKGATKSKNAAPKSKYIEHILTATYSDAGTAEIFRTLQIRLRESAWTVVFKALIVIHMMIREGAPGAALAYLSQYPRKFAITSISDAQLQGANIWRYSEYLIARSLAFTETKTDYVRNGQGRLKSLTVSRGLLRETEIVQKQIKALLKCDLLSDEPDNEITLTAFRLVTLDLLTLYSVMNEGVINVLEHYFEMSRTDSERALHLYKVFSALTDDVVGFLRVARQYEHATRLEIPNLKHASTDLAKLLEDDLHDPDFAIRRKEYREQKFGKSKGENTSSSKDEGRTQPKSKANEGSTSKAPSKVDAKAPAPDLIDFFGSIEENPQPVNQQQQQQSMPMQFQQTGFQQQPVPAEFLQNQTGFTTNQIAQTTNPFSQYDAHMQQVQQQQPPIAQPLQVSHTERSSSLPATYDGRSHTASQQSIPTIHAPTRRYSHSQSPSTMAIKRQSTNPFAKSPPSVPSQYQIPNPNQYPMPSTSPTPSQQQPQPLQPHRTGTNPFARPQPQQSQEVPPAQRLQPNPTGSTNPFRQSVFINQSTGQGWQNAPQGTMGGLEKLETIPVFPRPGQMA